MLPRASHMNRPCVVDFGRTIRYVNDWRPPLGGAQTTTMTKHINASSTAIDPVRLGVIVCVCVCWISIWERCDCRVRAPKIVCLSLSRVGMHKIKCQTPLVYRTLNKSQRNFSIAFTALHTRSVRYYSRSESLLMHSTTAADDVVPPRRLPQVTFAIDHVCLCVKLSTDRRTATTATTATESPATEADHRR